MAVFILMLLWGGTVVQWLALLSRSKKGPGWIPGIFLWSFHTLQRLCGVSPGAEDMDPKTETLDLMGSCSYMD